MKMTFGLIATTSTEYLYLICLAQEAIRILLEELTCKNCLRIVEARAVIALTGYFEDAHKWECSSSTMFGSSSSSSSSSSSRMARV
jgi:hypothetical protein